MTGSAIQVGLIGYGLGGRAFHAPFIDSTPGLRLSAVMTSNPARRQEVAERYPAATLASDIDALLALEPALDLIVISSPNATHAPLARAALAARRHVVVDKPFAATAKEAREIGRLAAAAERLAIPFQNRRWDGDFLTLQQLIRGGELGDVHRFESRFDRWRPQPKANWCRANAPESGEDILHDLGTHLVDQALQLFGPVSSVYAELSRLHPDVVTCDDAFLSLAHESGVRSRLHMTTRAGVPGPRMTVIGSRATYVKYGLDVQEDLLKVGTRPDVPGFGSEPGEAWGTLGSGETRRAVPTERGAYAEYYRAVERAIRESAPPPVSVDDVAAGLDIIEAAFRSASEGRPVAVSGARA